jgi:hypothetical protein
MAANLYVEQCKKPKNLVLLVIAALILIAAISQFFLWDGGNPIATPSEILVGGGVLFGFNLLAFFRMVPHVRATRFRIVYLILALLPLAFHFVALSDLMNAQIVAFTPETSFLGFITVVFNLTALATALLLLCALNIFHQARAGGLSIGQNASSDWSIDQTR